MLVTFKGNVSPILSFLIISGLIISTISLCRVIHSHPRTVPNSLTGGVTFQGSQLYAQVISSTFHLFRPDVLTPNWPYEA